MRSRVILTIDYNKTDVASNNWLQFSVDSRITLKLKVIITKTKAEWKNTNFDTYTNNLLGVFRM